jgi:hypothetical protein
MTKGLVFVLMFFCCFTMNSQAQDTLDTFDQFFPDSLPRTYETAAGARAGDGLSATLKHFLDENKALEVIMGFDRGISIIGVAELHRPLTKKQQGLNWYVGFGAYLYFSDFKDNTTFVGLAGAVGAEYVLPNKTFAFSMDWNPVLSFLGDFGNFNGRYGGVTAKYILK